MIRYPISRGDLENLVDAANGTWRTRARQRTQNFVNAGGYNERTGIWREIVDVFMKIQHNKCAYCERKLAGRQYGKIEHDLEHYRPKRSVRVWPQKKDRFRYPFPTGEKWSEGYYGLAYHLRNYATACKICNTILKKNFFPIAAQRVSGGIDPAQLVAEEPLLIYPLGDEDDDPADLITFVGILPIPRQHAGHAFRRARVTIDFFRLDIRDELLRGRAEQIRALRYAYEKSLYGSSAAARAEAGDDLNLILSEHMPHTNCVRAYYQLLQNDQDKADRLYQGIRKLLARRD